MLVIPYGANDITLVDDVMTTGATAWLAALACHLAGRKVGMSVVRLLARRRHCPAG